MLKHRKRALCLIALAMAASAIWGAVSLSAPPPGKDKDGDKDAGYTVVNLDPNPNATSSSASCINESGEIVGVIDGHAVYWTVDAEGLVELFPTMADFGGSGATHINDNGEVVGVGPLPEGGPQNGLYWQTPADNTVDPIVLPPLLGYNDSGALAINDNGLVVGWCGLPDDVNDPAEVAVAWQIDYDENGLAEGASPPVQLSASRSGAHDVNNAGQVVGSSGGRAVRWEVVVDEEGNFNVGEPFDLSQLGGGSWEFAAAINELGDVVGEGINSDGEHQRGFFYDGITGEIRDLATLGRNASQHPSSINDAATVEAVGHIYVFGPHGAWAAVRWKGDKATDLSKKIGGSDWHLNIANDVNNAGQIVGTGNLIGGEWRAFLLIPK